MESGKLKKYMLRRHPREATMRTATPGNGKPDLHPVESESKRPSMLKWLNTRVILPISRFVSTQLRQVFTSRVREGRPEPDVGRTDNRPYSPVFVPEDVVRQPVPRSIPLPEHVEVVKRSVVCRSIQLYYKHSMYTYSKSVKPIISDPSVCFVCGQKCKTAQELTAHMNQDTLHSTGNPIYSDMISSDKMFECTFTLDNSHESNKSLTILNIGNDNVHMVQMYVVNHNRTTRIVFEQTQLMLFKKLICRLVNNEYDQSTSNLFIIHAQWNDTKIVEYHCLDNAKCCTPTALKMQPVERYPQSAAITQLLTTKDPAQLKYFSESLCPLTTTNYSRVLSALNMVERIANQLDIAAYSGTNLNLAKGSGQHVYEVTFASDITKSMPNLAVGDKVNFTATMNKEVQHQGDIIELNQNLMLVEIKTYRKPKVDTSKRYDLTFERPSYTYDVETGSLQTVQKNDVIKYLFPKSASTTVRIARRSFDWFSADIESNERQQQAVRHIVAGTAHPHPYLLFGPPGTGKTKTLVEAISQIYLTDQNSRILISATSNAAADEISMRLVKNLPSICRLEHTFYRVYSNSFRSATPIDDALRQSSNYGLHFCPDYEHLKKFRIIITTLLVSAALRNTPLVFTHLFIDECGSATEIASLVPIALCSAPSGRVAKIVLAGDPMQLGPVVTPTAMDMGYGVSMLERLMTTCSVYQKSDLTGRFNPNVLTQLVTNYRSHPAIIDPSNQFFYQGDLIAGGRLETTHCFVGWRHLPNPSTPIIFHSCKAPSQMDEFSTSSYNMAEVKIIITYVVRVMNEKINGKQFTESDIGIISPYRQQCTKIKDALRNLRLNNIMVASVESFQGQEKPIMLISTTRSQTGIGFLRNPKRLNVMITRAQCLMVMVGNPYTLKQDGLWRRLLNEFEEKGVCTSGDVMPECKGPTAVKSKNRQNRRNKKHL